MNKNLKALKDTAIFVVILCAVALVIGLITALLHLIIGPLTIVVLISLTIVLIFCKMRALND